VAGLVFDAHGVKMTITDQKKNKIRYSRLVSLSEYLVQWKNDTHWSTEDSALVFISSKGNPMYYASLVMLIRRTATRAGITPPDILLPCCVNPCGNGGDIRVHWRQSVPNYYRERKIFGVSGRVTPGIHDSRFGWL
jgi:hypothetical protein